MKWSFYVIKCKYQTLKLISDEYYSEIIIFPKH